MTTICVHLDGAPTRCATCEGLHEPYEPPEVHGTERIRHEVDANEVERILAGNADKRPARLFRPLYEGQVRGREPIRTEPYVIRTRTAAERVTKRDNRPDLQGQEDNTNEAIAQRIEAGLAAALARLEAM